MDHQFDLIHFLNTKKILDAPVGQWLNGYPATCIYSILFTR